MLQALRAGLAVGVVLAANPIAGARPVRPPPPEGAAWQAWQDAIRGRFSYRQVEFGRVAHPIMMGGRDGCPKGPFQSPGLFSVVRSPNRKIFGEISVSIFPLEEKGDGNAFIKQSSVKRPEGLAEFPCIAVGDVALSMMQAGRFWVEVRGSCSDGDLYGYEVGEVLELVSTESLLAGLKQKKSFWGRTFPAARDAAKKALSR